jgi:hypothetical protein
MCREKIGVITLDIPFPFDHFFFCFLPADAAAGACKKILVTTSEGNMIPRTDHFEDVKEVKA